MPASPRRSLFVHLCGAKCFGNRWDEAKNDYNLNVINQFPVPFGRGTSVGQSGTGQMPKCGIPSSEMKENGVFTGIKGMKGINLCVHSVVKKIFPAKMQSRKESEKNLSVV